MPMKEHEYLVNNPQRDVDLLTLRRAADDKAHPPMLLWLAIFGGIILGVFLISLMACADKKTTRIFQEILPAVVDKPPIDCPKLLCRHGQKCEDCRAGEEP